ncbi:uncharacterized protein LOC143608708 [Bidens hawaiensis]|uniref:uncharacterized protein LOC143608708 n=1 Tax=Bidens hawaiensis TaxID=980011 RepID=UPI00404A8EB3
MQTLVPFLEEIEYDSDNFKDDVFGFDNSEELESLQAYFAPVEDLDFDGILQHVVNGSNLHKRTQTDTPKDTYEMVAIGLKHGDVRRDQLQVTSSDGAQRIVELAYWYKIPLRSALGENVQLRDDTLMFVRAVICFPHFASLILFKKEACAKKGVESVLASEQLPEAMKHVGFCGLIPKSCDPYLMKAYVYAHAAYMVDLGKLVNPDDRRSLKEMVSSQLDCSKAGVRKVPYDDEFRVGNLRAVGLTDAGVFKKIVSW